MSMTVPNQNADESNKSFGVTSQFASCKIGGMLLLKLIGFIEDERAEILDMSEDHVMLQMGQPWYRRWWNGTERRRPISVRIDFAELNPQDHRQPTARARRSLVNIEIQPLAWSFRRPDFQRRAESVLRSLRLHFVADS